MYKCFILVLVACITSLLSCTVPEPEEIQTVNPLYVNQINTKFDTDELQCLLNQYHILSYQDEGPVVFRVINDQVTYNTFFSCRPPTKLQEIDFTKFTLLTGMNSGAAFPLPVNIRKLNQSLIKDASGNFTLRVTVTGEQSLTDTIGSEWFAFLFLTPKNRR
jgi:hypothetical protein